MLVSELSHLLVRQAGMVVDLKVTEHLVGGSEKGALHGKDGDRGVFGGRDLEKSWECGSLPILPTEREGMLFLRNVYRGEG